MGKLVVGLARFLPLCTLLQALPAIAASRPAPFLFLSTYRARIVGRSLLRAPTLILVLFSVIGLTAYGGGGNRFGSTASAQTGPTPTIVTLSVNPKSIIAGQSATISWSATNATTPISSCTASGDWSGLKPTSSSQPEPVTPNKPGTTTYTLTCTGPGGTGSQSVNLTTQTTINANSTITVLATEGWQEIPFFLGNPVQFTITYVPGQRGWTVDKRNFSYVGLAGYTPDEDRQIFQGCKINSSWPYGALLGKIREGGAPFLVDHEGLYTTSQSGSLYLRIHDDDRCLVDNDGFLRIQVAKVPDMEPTNLIVLVHGCCTDSNGVNEWFDMRNVIINNILSQTNEVWQIVVWDWSAHTPGLDFPGAYNEAPNQGRDLATAILKRFQNGSYKYIHLIGHSAGARLIHTAASESIANNTIQQLSQQNKPFIHLTFLDAFRPPPVEDYGNLGNYPKYSSEHYVDVNNSPTVAFTNDYLPHAFNFDITNWTPDKDDRLGEFGHQWPRRWYQKSIITKKPDSTPAFAFGYTLSFEGSNGLYNSLSTMFQAGKHCNLTKVQDTCVQP